MAEILTMGELLVEIMRPHEDIPLYEPDYFRGPFPSGAPGIFISTAARLGHSAAIISGVGKDDFGETILRRLKKDGVDISRVLVSDQGNTGVAFVTYFADGERKFLFYMDHSPCVMAKAPEDMSGLEDTKFMHIMGCSLASNKEYAKEILKTMHAACGKGAQISFDPNVRKELFTDDSFSETLEDVLNHTSIFLPGVEELEMMMNKDTVEEAIDKCFTYPSMKMVLLKNGSKGSILYVKGQEPKVFNAYKIVQKDATGAGDCFDGAFLAGISQNKDLDTACRWASAAGALNAAAFGPMEGDISIETVEKMIEG